MKKTCGFLVVLLIFQSGHAFALSCHGTEPFWKADILKNTIKLTRLGGRVESFSIVKSEGAVGMKEEFLKSYFSSGARPVATVIRRECNDAMADYTYPQEIIIYTGRDTLYGCCGDPTPTL